MRDKRLLKEFGGKIRLKRMAMNISQMKLAELTECSLNAIGNIERGLANSSLTMVYRVAKALKVHPRDILP